MKQVSRRVRRMERHHRMGKGSPLNLVSLMDIFTILVFSAGKFLQHASAAKPKDLALPKSTAQKVPEDTLVLAITPQSILLQGREVAKVQELLANQDDVIPPLKQALENQRDNRQLRRAESDTEEAITILGDENISYALLHKILATCQQANYTKIAFAAHQLAKPKN